MSHFICPNCNAEAVRLVAFTKPKSYLGCESCGTKSTRFSKCNLGQTSDKWVGTDGKVHRITEGKRWEMEHRQLSRDDGKTVINTATGRPTEL